MYVRALGQARDNQAKRGWPYSMSMGLCPTRALRAQELRYEFMLGVRQWRHVALRHGAFCVSRQHRLRRWWPAHFMCYSWKAHVYSSMKQCLQLVNHEQFPIQMKQQQTQQVAGNHRFLTKTHREPRRRQQEAVGKAQRTSLSRVKAMSSTQQPQTYTGAATKIIPLHYKWSQWREGIPTADASKSDGEIRQHLQFTVKLSSPIRYTIFTMHVKNIFPTDRRQPISLYTVSNLGF